MLSSELSATNYPLSKAEACPSKRTVQEIVDTRYIMEPRDVSCLQTGEGRAACSHCTLRSLCTRVAIVVCIGTRCAQTAYATHACMQFSANVPLPTPREKYLGISNDSHARRNNCYRTWLRKSFFGSLNYVTDNNFMCYHCHFRVEQAEELVGFKLVGCYQWITESNGLIGN